MIQYMKQIWDENVTEQTYHFLYCPTYIGYIQSTVYENKLTQMSLLGDFVQQ